MKEFWNERYNEKEYAYGKDANDFLKECMSTKGSGDLLCLAEGQGRNAVYLAGLGYNVTAMDMAEMGLKRAQELADSKNVKIKTECADLNTYDLGENKWDRVVSIFGHLPEELRKSVHKRIGLALKKGGYFILEGYAKEQLRYKTSGPSDVSFLYSIEELEDDFEGILDIVILEKQEREVIEGKYHSGKAVTIQFLGRKK